MTEKIIEIDGKSNDLKSFVPVKKSDPVHCHGDGAEGFLYPAFENIGSRSIQHVAISMAIKYLSPKMVRATQLLNLIFVGLFAVALIWYGLIFFENSTQLFMVSDTLQISHKWTALSIPVCGLIMCVHLLSGVSLVQHLDITTELD